MNQLCFKIKKALTQNNIDKFGMLLDKSWKIKKMNNKQSTNTKIDKIYEIIKNNGASGGKILGAGGGGHFLVVAHPRYQSKIINELKKLKISNKPFNFTEQGFETWIV